MDETESYVISDANFHDTTDLRMARAYLGLDPVFVDIGFRGAAKTSRKKVFRAFVIACDRLHRHRYFKIITKDPLNSRQIVTDIFNMLVDRRVKEFWPEIFQKTEEKRTETMEEFDTATGVKMVASVVTGAQRGQVQDQRRPDDVWCDDFETRIVLRSAVNLDMIWGNMEEARTGLSQNGSITYTCNYLSERGNVHKLVLKFPEYTVITPIKGRVENGVWMDGPIAWPSKYSDEEVDEILLRADDPAGEYLCVPSIGEDVYFDRTTLDKQERKKPVREIAGFKIFHEYVPSHRYGAGADIGGGVGLDSSTSVFIDFHQLPARVVATYKCNTIEPTVFGDELRNQGDRFGGCIIAPENNKFDACIGRLKQIYDNIYFTEDKRAQAVKSDRKTYGWNTNTLTKGTMLSNLKTAVADGHLELSDPDIIDEMRAYTRDDFMEKEIDPRLTTRHFDLLIAVAIAWQMKDHAEAKNTQPYQQAPYEPTSQYEQTYGKSTHQINIHPM